MPTGLSKIIRTLCIVAGYRIVPGLICFTLFRDSASSHVKTVTQKTRSDSVNNIKSEFVTGGYVLYETETVMIDIKKKCE